MFKVMKKLAPYQKKKKRKTWMMKEKLWVKSLLLLAVNKGSLVQCG
jgi:hypothetical protein